MRGRVLVLILSGSLVGCVAEPPADRSDEVGVSAPDTWSAEGEGPTTVFEPGWLDDFESPRLAKLVRQALRHNYDLVAAARRVESARAGAVIAGADRLPLANLRGGVSRQFQSGRRGGRVVRSRSDTFRLALDVTWEVDVWGKLQDRASAATADYQASRARYRGARLSIAAQTAQAWFDAIEASRQLALARETLQAFRENLEIVRERFRRGVGETSALDVRLLETNVAQAQSSVARRKRQLDAAERALEVLLGEYPDRSLEIPDRLPTLKEAVPAGAPAALLARRPDLVVAERRLAAAGERVEVAEKELLPDLSLTGSVGGRSDDLVELVESPTDFGTWSLASDVLQPVFQGGRLLARIDQAEATVEERRAAYAQAALRAFREVETTLAAERYLAREEEAIRKRVDAATRAKTLSEQRYRRGIVGVVTVLEAQRRAFRSQQDLLAIRNQRLQNRVDLYLALGGAVEARPVAAAPTAEEDTR